MAVTTSFFGTVGAFSSHEFIINEHAVGQAKAEELLTCQIEEEVERLSPSRCAADPNMMSDERKLDPQCQPSHKHICLFHLVRFSPGAE